MSADQTNDQRSLDPGPTFSLIRSLSADRRTRETSGCLFVEGIRNFITALDHGWSVETIVYSERLLIAPVARKWVRRLKRANTPYCRLTPEEFRSISCAPRASGIGAVLRQKVVGLEQVPVRERECWMAVGQIHTPGNLGTLIRTACAAGASGGARVMLMIGEERRGLTAEQRTLCNQLVRIPMQDRLDSLNAAVVEGPTDGGVTSRTLDPGGGYDPYNQTRRVPTKR